MNELHSSRSVPSSHSKECGTAGQNTTAWDKAQNKNGTVSLKTLANHVISQQQMRDILRDTGGTNTQSPVPQTNHTCETFAERVAIIQHDAGIPREWAEAFARVCLMPKPETIPAEEWRRVLDGMGKLLDGYIPALVQHGWNLADIFGCHPTAPASRYDCKGLLLLMREHEVISIINAQSIALQNPKTGATLFYRRPLNPNSERIMIWELK